MVTTSYRLAAWDFMCNKINKINENSYKLIFGINNESQVEEDHVEVHPFVLFYDFFEILVGLRLSVLVYIYFIQPF